MDALGDPSSDRRRTGLLDRLLQAFIRSILLGPPRRPSKVHPETAQPGERRLVPGQRLVRAYLLAVVLPVLTAAALIPLRADHGRAMAIVLVVPVVVTALLGATGPSAVAALSAGIAYDVLLTQPYYRLVIDDPDDVVAVVVLVAVGLVVGVLSSRILRLTARSTAREAELHHLVQFVHAVAHNPSEEELAGEACERIAAVLGLQECRWRPGYHGHARPLLLPDGHIMGYVSELNPDRAKLPSEVELAALAGSKEVGRFILRAGSDRVVSYEERLTAAAIASLFAAVTVAGPASTAPGGSPTL